MECRRLFAAGLLLDAVGLSAAASVDVNGTSYFLADDGVHGRELWKSDGLPDGTRLVKDLTPGADGSTLHAIARVGDRVVFVTVAAERWPDGRRSSDYTVWSSDGTADGTVVLAQFNDAFVVALKQVGQRVALAVSCVNPAEVGDNGRPLVDAMLYFSDATAQGTQLVKTFTADTDPPSSEDGPSQLSYAIWNLYAVGDRVVFTPDDRTLWSSDGTVNGNVDLSEKFEPRGFESAASISNIAEADGKVLIPSQTGDELWVTDGTSAGTIVHSVNPNVWGSIDYQSAFVHRGAYYFVQVTSSTTALVRVDLDTFAVTTAYQSPGGIGVNRITTKAAGDRILIFDMEINDGGTGEMWSTNGVGAPTKLADLAMLSMVLSPVMMGDSLYFLMISGGYDPAMEGVAAGFVGSRIQRTGLTGRGVNTTDYKFQLWRSDGTVDGTGVVRDVFSGDINGEEVLITLTPADGTLTIRTEVATGITPGQPYSSSSLTDVSDVTEAYQPQELTLARDGASVRVVNGVLCLGGSPDADNFRLYRSPADPDELIVEYNGYTRTFPFNSIRRIVADLQDGDDRFEIAEQIDGEFRLWTSITGGGGADTIIGGTGRDTIFGGSGNDFIRSRGNTDLVNGGPGRDRITGGEGDDLLASGGGHDSILAGTGLDVLFGQDAVGRRFARVWATLEETEDDMALQSL